ncbi:TetR family transcriptional regulator C-terminal domain-containing protein [Streptomyces sp. NPDC102437]|uniref:TetR family transcriptional regulator C-terminal domain-containing protein n=1 Tax=Streptomyces sp. NPDC102437 TaxID=3366175 RepID=UPI003816A677
MRAWTSSRVAAPLGARDPRWTLWIELWARTASNEPLRQAQAEIDRGWQEDLESLLAKGVRQGRFAEDPDTATRASELLALLDGLSTRVVLGQRGADRASALRMALSVTERLVERGWALPLQSRRGPGPGSGSPPGPGIRLVRNTAWRGPH